MFAISPALFQISLTQTDVHMHAQIGKAFWQTNDSVYKSNAWLLG